jgi:DNA-binding NarL/FixJ family response regulator
METIRVLIADDHPLFRDALMALLLAEPDIELVAQAVDGEEAVKLAGELLPDVAIIDAAMPKLNGIEATRRIRGVSPKTAILIISSFGDDSYLFGAIDAGAAGYVLKSVRGQELIITVRAIHGGKTVLDPSVAKKLFKEARRSSVVHGVDEMPGHLHPREVQVLSLVAKGMSNKGIADQLSLSVHTVQAHMINIFRRLGVKSRSEAVARALNEGRLSIDDWP